MMWGVNEPDSVGIMTRLFGILEILKKDVDNKEYDDENCNVA